MARLSTQINKFNKSLHIPVALPTGVEILNPFKNAVTVKLSEQFYNKFYSDDQPRTMIIGINPGRFGSGITGVPFTDPINLEKFCSIENSLPKKHELSSDFIHQVIEAFGGLTLFYKKFYFTSVSPLGFTKNGKNLNYYDEKLLQDRLQDFIMQCITTQLSWGLNRKVAYVLGEGKNFKFVQQLNAKHNFFEVLQPLSHPRYIMQYKRKKLGEYVKRYVDLLNTEL